MEIENPWRMAIWNVISPNPTSNIWWMGTLYGMAVGLILLARLNMVVAGQLVPSYEGFENLPQYAAYDYLPKYFDYVPSSMEWLVAFGGIGLTCLAFILGERFFGKAFADHGDH